MTLIINLAQLGLLFGLAFNTGHQTKDYSRAIRPHSWMGQGDVDFALYLRYEKNGMCSIYVNQGEARIAEFESQESAVNTFNTTHANRGTKKSGREKSQSISCSMSNKNGQKIRYVFQWTEKENKGEYKSAIVKTPDQRISLKVGESEKEYDLSNKTKGTISVYRDGKTGEIVKIFGKVTQKTE